LAALSETRGCAGLPLSFFRYNNNPGISLDSGVVIDSCLFTSKKRLVVELESPSKKGYIYILINPAFPDYVKFGKTTKDSETRAKEISRGAGVPAPYRVAWDVLVTDCDQVERLVHQKLFRLRARNDREFFVLPLREAISVLMDLTAPFRCTGIASSSTSSLLSQGEGLSSWTKTSTNAIQPPDQSTVNNVHGATIQPSLQEFTPIVAEEMLDHRLIRTGVPTKYIAGFRTGKGRELALERARHKTMIWVEVFD
jgi:hypothetical protein